MSESEQPNLYYTAEFLELLKANTHMSPHTVRLLNNPLHVYLCEGETCRDATNRAEQK